MIGTTLSHFKITAKLGEGGMGEVYRATDTKLDREVAIKLLPEAFTNDPQRLVRFRREAKLLASLSHPNIAGIYGLEESGDSQFLTLELVEGENLAERLERGRIEVDDALELARQMASGLEAAHDRGIVHRDFKPANVMVTPDGQAKILDFGLAKAREASNQSADLSQLPTLAAPMTQAGVILGTAGYMSPEQARGEETDKRTDIWAFGVVFWEMLTGKRLFRGRTSADVLAAVLRGEIDWAELPTASPAAVRRILDRCLVTDLTKRWKDVGDVRVEIERLQAGEEEFAAFGLSGDGRGHGSARKRLPWILVGVLFMALALVGVQGLRWSDEVHPILRLEIDLSSVGALAQRGGPSMTLSPDGSKLALVAGDPPNTKLYIRSLDSLEAILLPGTEGALNPFFSPDGQEIGFFAQGKLKRISVSSPRAQTICTAAFGLGGSWGSDGTIVFATAARGPLLRVPAAGGEPVAATRLEDARDETLRRWPQLLPGDEWVLYTASKTARDFSNAVVEVESLATGERKILVEKAYFGRYVSSGHLIFVREETLFVVPFDSERVEIVGPPVPTIEELATDPREGWAQLAFSRSGSLVYVTGKLPGWGMEKVLAVWVDRRGERRPLLQEPGLYYSPRFSPDGGRLAFHRGGEFFSRTTASDIWVSDLGRDTVTRVTFDQSPDYMPIWVPDGSRLIFSSERESGVPNLFWKRADGGGEAVRLAESNEAQWPGSMTPDGKTLLYIQYSLRGDHDIWALPMNENGAAGPAELVLGSPILEWRPELSPDGRWLAYSTSESGRFEVYVTDFPGLERKWQVSSQQENYENIFVRWARSAPELFYRGSERQVMVVPFQSRGGNFRAAKPRLLYEGNFLNRRWPDWDVAPDGEGFVMFESVVDAAVNNWVDGDDAEGPKADTGRTILVSNWTSELEKLAPAKEQ